MLVNMEYQLFRLIPTLIETYYPIRYSTYEYQYQYNTHVATMTRQVQHAHNSNNEPIHTQYYIKVPKYGMQIK